MKHAANPALITLTTDFGTQDWFVGTMKGVVLKLAPKARIVDLTHEIPSGDIRSGAFALAASVRFFPKATIHVAVIDPGVGSRRKAIAIQTRNCFFVGPDNGVFSLALQEEKIISIVALENQKYFRPPVSATFQGRDVFAPVAAHIARGTAIKHFGPACKDLVQIAWSKPREKSDQMIGEIIYIDRFGNAITNIPAAWIQRLDHPSLSVVASRRLTCPIKPFYQAVAPKQPVAVPGSTGFVEIALNGASAAKKFGLKIGMRVVGFV